MDSATIILLILFFFSLLLIAIGLITRWTGGLFLSRTPQDYKKDRYDSNFESERQSGMRLSNGLMKYVPPVSVSFLVLLILKMFHII